MNGRFTMSRAVFLVPSKVAESGSRWDLLSDLTAEAIDLGISSVFIVTVPLITMDIWDCNRCDAQKCSPFPYE